MAGLDTNVEDADTDAGGSGTAGAAGAGAGSITEGAPTEGDVEALSVLSVH